MPQTDDYAAGEAARLAAYKAAFESDAARAWIAQIPKKLLPRAAELGLLKPAPPPPSFAIEYKERASASNWRANQFDENDFAAAALDAGREIDESARPESEFNEYENEYENDD